MSSESGFIEVPGGRLYFERSGAGSPIVFIHAAIADHRMWGREFHDYAGDHTIVRYDVRGLGRSTAATAPYSDVDDLAAVLDRAGLPKATLIGCSNGGRMAIDFALTHPERIDRLVLIAPGLGGYALSGDPEEKAVFDRSGERFAPILASFKSGDTEAALQGLREFWCRAQTGASLELVVRMLRENLQEVFTDSSASHAKPLEPPAAGRLASLSAPTLLLLGDQDAEESRFFVERIAQGIPGAVRTMVPGADHLINLSRPKEFDAAVREFLARPA